MQMVPGGDSRRSDPSGESFPAHQIPLFITAGGKPMLHITEQMWRAAPEPGHRSSHRQHSHSLCRAWRLPHTRTLSLAWDQLGRDLVPCRETSHPPKVSAGRHIPLPPLCQLLSHLLPVCSLSVHQDPTLLHNLCTTGCPKH